MNTSLQNIIDRYKNGLLETRNLQISNEKFVTEVISDESLYSSMLAPVIFTTACLKTVSLKVHHFARLNLKIVI